MCPSSSRRSSAGRRANSGKFFKSVRRQAEGNGRARSFRLLRSLIQRHTFAGDHSRSSQAKSDWSSEDETIQKETNKQAPANNLPPVAANYSEYGAPSRNG